MKTIWIAASVPHTLHFLAKTLDEFVFASDSAAIHVFKFYKKVTPQLVKDKCAGFGVFLVQAFPTLLIFFCRSSATARGSAPTSLFQDQSPYCVADSLRLTANLFYSTSSELDASGWDHE